MIASANNSEQQAMNTIDSIVNYVMSLLVTLAVLFVMWKLLVYAIVLPIKAVLWVIERMLDLHYARERSKRPPSASEAEGYVMPIIPASMTSKTIPY